MDKRKLEHDELIIKPNDLVKVKKMNHIINVQYMEKRNTEQRIQKLNADEYVDLCTGEIREFEHALTRADLAGSIRKTFLRLSDLIVFNFVGAANELFITLTYRGELQTNDTKRVYEDFKKFAMRLKYAYKDISTIDYINVLEPHASGKFHMHVLVRFNDIESIYIPNEVDRKTGESINAPLRDLWGNGNVTIKSLSGVDNLGAYLTAYLSDIEVPENYEHEDAVYKEVDGKQKKFIKGGRLAFYPPGTNIYRKSKGIVHPDAEMMRYKDIKKVVGNCAPHYRVGTYLSDESADFSNTIINEQYNTKRQ